MRDLEKAEVAAAESHHDAGFIRKYVFSLDHKIIGLQYFFTALGMAVIGGLLSVLMRLQLGWPTAIWPTLGKILPVGMENGVMAPEFYLSLQTCLLYTSPSPRD